MSANPLTSTLAALLERAANAALSSDPEAGEALAALDGQILLLRLTTLPNIPELAIRIQALALEGGSLRVMADTTYATQPPHAIVNGTLADVLASLFREDLAESISIQGDERLLMALKGVFANLQPQWRERFEEFAERIPALNGAASAPIVQDLLGQAELAFDTLRTSFGDLLGSGGARAQSESAKFWAQESDLEDFATRLENLQLSVDRLRAQIDQLDKDVSTDSTRAGN